VRQSGKPYCMPLSIARAKIYCHLISWYNFLLQYSYFKKCSQLYNYTAIRVKKCSPLHYTTLHYTTLHYTTLHYTTLHYTTLQLYSIKPAAKSYSLRKSILLILHICIIYIEVINLCVLKSQSNL
jgi:hypothetical protein